MFSRHFLLLPLVSFLLFFCFLCQTAGGAQGNTHKENTHKRAEDTFTFASLYLWLDQAGEAVVGVHCGNDAFADELEADTPNAELPLKPFNQALGGTIVPIGANEQVTDPEEWQVLGHCEGMFRLTGGLRQGRIDLQPLLPLLHARKVRWLTVSVLPASVPHFDAAGIRPSPRHLRGYSHYYRTIDLTDPPQARQPIILSYGYARADIARIVGPLLLVLLAPLGLTLWIRSRALRAEEEAAARGKSVDPAVVWFGYSRYLQTLSTGIWIAWVPVVIAGQARHLVTFLIGHSWLAHSGLPILLLYLPALVIVACYGLSHPVFAQVRGLDYTRAEMVRQAAWGQSRLLPLICLLNGLTELVHDPRLAAAWFLGAFVLNVLTAQAAMRALGSAPQALTTGELRDRVFALAKSAGVPLRQVYLMPAGKRRMANAFASIGSNIILTDYLLQRLNRHEVDAVVGHELTHLRRRHPQALHLAFLAIFIAAGVVAGYTQLWTTLPVVSGPVVSGGSYALLALTGLFLTYAMARRFEWTADAGAVQLTGNGEALITGLAKISLLNMTPLHWGAWQGKWVTHPQTSHRMQRIGQTIGLSADQVQVLAQTQVFAQTSQAPSVEERVKPAFSELEYYPVPALEPNTQVFSARRRAALQLTMYWLSLVMTPTIAAAATLFRNWPLLLLGVVLALVLPRLVLEGIQQLWYAHMERLLRQKLEAESQLKPGEGAEFVAYSPDRFPRLYEGFYDFDLGFFQITDRTLRFVGEKVSFALNASQITKIEMREDTPSLWRRWPLLYVRWQDSAAVQPSVVQPSVVQLGDVQLGDVQDDSLPVASDQFEQYQTFNLRPGAGGSLWQARRAARTTLRAIQTERVEYSASLEQSISPEQHPTVPERLPPSDQVTAISPRQLLTGSGVVQALIVQLGFVVGINLLFKLPISLPSEMISSWTASAGSVPKGFEGWYVLIVTLISLNASLIPLGCYRDAKSESAD